MSDLTEGYVCAACDAKPDHKCYLRNGRWLCGPCYDMERIKEFEKDIASMRASVERLTAERDAATNLMEFWRAKSRERMAGLDFRRIVASVAVEMDQIGGGGSSASNVRAWASRLSDALAGLPENDAESAEATIERLTRERDEAIGALRLSETRVTMLLGVERTHVAFSKTLHDLVGLDTSGDFDPDALPDRLRELVAIEQAWEAEHGPDGGKSAEATIARLAMVVRAAGEVCRWASDTRIPGEVPVAAVAKALSSLTAEDRRRAGIEG